MKILNVQQIRQLDAYTIENEPITSIDLMERASETFVRWFVKKFHDDCVPIAIYCGNGNNGGDGLAIARLLRQRNYEPTVYWCKISPKSSADFLTNLKWLQKIRTVSIEEVNIYNKFPKLEKGSILIDAIFGSGLNRPIDVHWTEMISHLNQQEVIRISIDIPSGLFADKNTVATTFLADYTFSFQLPKFAFFFQENQDRVGEWISHSIGLDKSFIAAAPTPFYFVDDTFAKGLLKQRKKFSHKGTFGHALVVAGSYGKIGAAILAAKACLRSGAGLVTLHIPKCGYAIVQSSFPEAMVSVDNNEKFWTEVEGFSQFTCIGVGCGIGTDKLTIEALSKLIENSRQALVLDADALNILSEKLELLKKLPKNSILTPHPKEFERLFGRTKNNFERNELQRQKSQELEIFIVLKGANTCTSCPDGNCYFNSTGNPGMATGGSGDALTGMLTGFLAQGYSPFEACILGVYLHGLSGDLAAKDLQQEALLAGDLIDYIGKAFKKLKTTP